MLRKMMRDPASEASDGAMAKARGSSFFSVPRLFVEFTSKCLSDCDSSRSPTSPLDLKAFSSHGGSLLKCPRSARSWDCKRVGLGLVDTLAGESKPCSESRDIVFGSHMRLKASGLKSYNSLPKDCGNSLQEFGHLRFGCEEAAAPRPKGGELLGKARSCSSAEMEVGGQSLPCTRFYGDLRPQSNFKNHLVDSGKVSGSLPASIGVHRRYIGSISASEIEQSEDYTCIISHGPNPKTTHIFGDCILETQAVQLSDDKNEETKEGAESYWLVECPVDPAPFPCGDFLSICFCCKKKLEGNDIYIYRGEKAFCSCNCRDQEILIEEEGEKNATDSPVSNCSSFHDDIFMDGMVVAT